MRTTLISFQKQWLILFLGSCSIWGFAQPAAEQLKVAVVEDTVQVRKQFKYVIQKKDTIYSGPYTIQIAPISTTSKRRFLTLELPFDKGDLDGVLSFKSATVVPEQHQGYFEGYHWVQPTSGTAKELKGAMKNGKPDGTWSIDSYQVTQASRDSTNCSTTFAYQSGQLTGTFTQKNQDKESQLKGELLNCALDGKWEYEEPKAISAFELHFEKGKLRTVQLGKAEAIRFADTLPVASVPMHLSLPEIIYFNSFSADLTDTEREDYKVYLSKVWHILQETATFLRFSNVQEFTALPVAIELGSFTIQVPHYPLQSTEEALLQQLTKDFSTLEERIATIKNNDALGLAQYKDAQLARSVVRIKLLNDRFQEIKKALHFFQTTSGAFVNRTDFTHVKAVLFAKPVVEKIDFKGETLKDSVAIAVEVTEKYTGVFSGWLSEITSQLEAEENQINSRLKELQLTKKLNSQEANLVEKSNHLDSLFQQFGVSFFDALKTETYLNGFVTAKKRLMETYATASKNEKITLGEATHTCLDTLLFLFNKSAEVIRFENDIFKAYHEEELNPVTWTKMETTKYERIYSGYKEKVVPHLFQQIEEASKGNCTQFAESVYELHKVLYFILSLEEQAPHKLNRRLRNGDSATLYLEKLEYK